MKRVLQSLKFVAVFVATFLVTTGTLMVYRSEMAFINWQERVESVEQVEQVNMQILRAQEYNREVMSAVAMLATENGLLCEREQKTTLYVAGLDEENAKLKAALAESVENLEMQIEELNLLHNEVSRLRYKVQTLEAALELATPTPAPEQSVNDVKNDLLDILELADTVLTILPILL